MIEIREYQYTANLLTHGGPHKLTYHDFEVVHIRGPVDFVLRKFSNRDQWGGTYRREKVLPDVEKYALEAAQHFDCEMTKKKFIKQKVTKEDWVEI